MRKRTRWLASTRAALTRKRYATTTDITCLLICAVCVLCILAQLLMEPEPREEQASYVGGVWETREAMVRCLCKSPQPKPSPQWFPKTPVDEATWRQLRDPTKSPSIRTKQLASGSLRVSTTEFRGVLASARRDELDIRAGHRPPQKRSLLCGEVICAPVFASAQ